jgi:uncharacterized protein
VSYGLDDQDLMDLASGSTVLGVGGGGASSLSGPMIESIKKRNRTRLISPELLGDASWGAVSFAVGTPSALEGVAGPDVAEALVSAAVRAFQQLMRDIEASYPERVPQFIVAAEVGLVNSLLPVAVAGELRLPLVDASGSAVSIPQMTMTTFRDLPMSPVHIGHYKDPAKSLSLNVRHVDAAQAPIMRVIDDSTFGHCAGVAAWPMSTRSLQKSALIGSLSRAIALGKVMREGPVHSRVDRICRELGGRVLFEGRLVTTESRVDGGFDVMRIELVGASGEIFSIYAQNESLVAWAQSQSRPVAMAPDWICTLDRTGSPVTNAELRRLPGEPELIILGVPAPREIRQNDGVLREISRALRRLGYGGSYEAMDMSV